MEDAAVTIMSNPILSIHILTSIIIFVVGTFVCVKKMWELLEKWRKHRNKDEEKDTTINKRLAKLEESDDKQIARLESICHALSDIRQNINDIYKDNCTSVLITEKNLIYRIYQESIARGYLTMAEKEMFTQLIESYQAHNGNGVFKHDVIPAVEELPVHD